MTRLGGLLTALHQTPRGGSLWSALGSSQRQYCGRLRGSFIAVAFDE